MLTITVMCDADGVATAKMTATKDGRELAFCGHHGDKHAVALMTDGWELTAIQQPEDVESDTDSLTGTAVPVTVIQGDSDQYFSDGTPIPDEQEGE